MPDARRDQFEDATITRKWIAAPGRLLIFTSFVVLISIFLWIGLVAQRNTSRRQHFERLGGQVTTVPASPVWLHDLVSKTIGNKGAAWLTHMSSVSFQDVPVADSELGALSTLTDSEIKNLERLNLENTRVTDASLPFLRNLTSLKRLVLENTKVSDSGLQYLSGLTSLEGLNLESTQVTDAGLHHLSGLINVRDLSLNGTQVTDEGLAHLTGLTNLQHLDLRNTKVTDAGIEGLRSRLPGIKILH